MQTNRSISGRIAKREGIGFESFMDRQAAKQGYVVVNIADGCKRISKYKLIPMQQPFDRVYVKHGISIFTDLKSYDASTLTYSNCQKFSHQIDKLCDLEEQKVIAGFTVYLRELQTISFFRASLLADLEPKSSLQVSLGIELGDLFSVDLDQIVSCSSDLPNRSAFWCRQD